MTEKRWYNACIPGDENILWHGRPRPGWYAEPMDVFLLPLCAAALALLGFTALNIPTDAPQEGVRLAYAALALLTLPELYVLLTTFLYRPFLLRRTEYAITQRRILRCRAGHTDVILRQGLPAPVLTALREGFGTIRLGLPRSVIPPEHTLDQATFLPASFRLQMIPDAERVLALLQEPPAPLPIPVSSEETPLLPLPEGETLLWQSEAEFSPPGAPMGSLRRFLIIWTALLAGLGSVVMRVSGEPRLIWLPALGGMLTVWLLLGRTLPERLMLRRPLLLITDQRILYRRFLRVRTLKADKYPLYALHREKDGTATLLLARVAKDNLTPFLRQFNRSSVNPLHMDLLRVKQLRFIPNAARAMDVMAAQHGAADD